MRTNIWLDFIWVQILVINNTLQDALKLIFLYEAFQRGRLDEVQWLSTASEVQGMIHVPEA